MANNLQRTRSHKRDPKTIATGQHPLERMPSGKSQDAQHARDIEAQCAPGSEDGGSDECSAGCPVNVIRAGADEEQDQCRGYVMRAAVRADPEAWCQPYMSSNLVHVEIHGSELGLCLQ